MRKGLLRMMSFHGVKQQIEWPRHTTIPLFTDLTMRSKLLAAGSGLCSNNSLHQAKRLFMFTWSYDILRLESQSVALFLHQCMSWWDINQSTIPVDRSLRASGLQNVPFLENLSFSCNVFLRRSIFFHHFVLVETMLSLLQVSPLASRRE